MYLQDCKMDSHSVTVKGEQMSMLDSICNYSKWRATKGSHLNNAL